jgi:hypothetical protein
LLELLIHDRDLRGIILPQLEESDYIDLATGEIFEALIAIDAAGQEIGPETMLEHLGDDESALDLAHELLKGPPRRQKEDAIDEVLLDAENCVCSLRGMAISNRIIEISREASAAEQAGDIGLFNQLTFEQLELEKIRRELGKPAA